MSRSKPLIISIPEPCSEDWDKMSPSEQGRFCGACQRTIVDFSVMDDAEVLRYFSEHQHLCGRFVTEQLNRPLQPGVSGPRYWLSPFYKKIAAGLVFLLSFTGRSAAQQKKTTPTQQSPAAQRDKMMVISGHLLDSESRKPLAAQTVWLRGTDLDQQVLTNKWGGFSFRVPVRYRSEMITLHLDNEMDPLYYTPATTIAPGQGNADILIYRLKADPSKQETVDRSLRIERVERHTMGVPPRYNVIMTGPAKKNGWQRFWYRCTHPFKRKVH